MEAGGFGKKTAEAAGAVLDRNRNGEVSWKDLSNTDIAKLKLTTSQGAKAASLALGIPISKSLTATDARSTIRSAVMRYIQRNNVEEIKTGGQTDQQYEREKNSGHSLGNATQKNATESIIRWLGKGETITADQYKALRSYADERGIILQGFKDSDVDLYLAKEVIDAASKFLTIYPGLRGRDRRKFTINLSKTMHPNDFAMTYINVPHILYLNADAYRNKSVLQQEYAKLAEEGWFVKGTTYMSIIYHEIGHMLESLYGINAIDLMTSLLGTRNEAETLMWCRKFLSEYSAKIGGEEIMSEAFACYYGAENVPQQIIDFVQKCAIILVGRDYDDRG